MSVTYSETGSNYTYLDANNLPVDYGIIIRLIRTTVIGQITT